VKTDPFLAYYEGRDSGPNDVNCWHGWRHGHMTEHCECERRPMSLAEVEEAFAKLNRGRPY
jgi:hypothetical protein